MALASGARGAREISGTLSTESVQQHTPFSWSVPAPEAVLPRYKGPCTIVQERLERAMMARWSRGAGVFAIPYSIAHRPVFGKDFCAASLPAWLQPVPGVQKTARVTAVRCMYAAD